MHVAKVGRKTSILTGRGHWQKQGQGEGTMYWRIGEERRGEERDKCIRSEWRRNA